MAVVPRRRKGGTTKFGVSNEWQGKPVWELVGTSRREAEIRDRAMKKEIKDGTFVPKAGTRALNVVQFSETWAAGRTNASAGDERRLLRLYLYPRAWLCDMRLDEAKPAITDQIIRELRAEKKPDGSRRVKDKTIGNFLGVLRLVFKAAIRQDLCVRQPIMLEKGMLDTAPTEEVEIYEKPEVVALTRHHSIPWPIRVLNALCALAGLREGEAVGLKWSDLDFQTEPLRSFEIRRQYEGRKLKTKRPRVVPVHPELRKIIDAWGMEGFELYTGARPTPDDFIVPNCSPRAKVRHHTRSSYYKQFVKHAEAAGVRPRSLHATRHTFITLCRRAGARKDVLERVTHNACGTMIDRYTHFDFAPLCEAVLCLNLDVHPDPQRGSGSLEDSGGGGPLPSGPNGPRLLGTAIGPPSSIPGASTPDHLEKSQTENARQETRQEFSGTLEEFRAANRVRRRALLSLEEADPKAALPGLAFTRALDEALRGDDADRAVMASELAKAGGALEHLLPEEAKAHLAGGKRGGR